MKWRTITTVGAWCLSLVCLFIALFTPVVLTMAQTKAAKLPEDLAAVPPDALAFIHMRVGEVWTSPTFRYVQTQLEPKGVGELNRLLEKSTGLTIDNIDRATLVLFDASMQKGPEGCVIVQTRNAVDREKVVKALLREAQQDSATGVFTSPASGDIALRFLNNRLIVIGTREGVRRQHASSKSEGPLAGSLKEAAGRHQLTAGFYLSREMSVQLRKMYLEEIGELGVMLDRSLHWIFDVRHGLLALDLGYTTTCKVELTFGGEWQAKRAFRAAHGGILLLQTLCSVGQVELKDTLHVVQLLSALETAMDEATVELQGTTVRASMTAKFPPSALDQATLQAFQLVDLPDERRAGAQNLRQLAIGFHNYHGDYDRLPPHAIYSKDGKPLLSWRVALLPYLDQDRLYRQFRLDEPWDSEHNKKLLPQMPKAFELSSSDAQPGQTYYQIVVTPPEYKGPYKTIFPLALRGQMTLGQITVKDGTSNTIMIMEADKAVPWTKPEDVILPADDKQLPIFGADNKSGKFYVVFGDGSVYTLRSNIAQDQYQKLMRQMLGANDGENADTAPILGPADRLTPRPAFGHPRPVYPTDTRAYIPSPRPAATAMTRRVPPREPPR